MPQNVFTSIDKETGRPEVDMAHKPATGKSAQFCPGLWGGKDWPFEAYNPEDRPCLHSVQRKPLQHAGRQSRRACSGAVVDWRRRPGPPLLGRHEGGLLWRTPGHTTSTPGKRVWRDLYSSSMMWGSLLTTAGGLVFGGGTNDREFRAYDAKHWRAALALPYQLRYHRPALDLRGQWRPVRRGSSLAGASTPPSSRGS